MSVIQSIINTTVKPLTYIVNLSLSNGIFPDHLKTSRIVPLFKLEINQYLVTTAQFQYFLHFQIYLKKIFIIDLLTTLIITTFCVRINMVSERVTLLLLL